MARSGFPSMTALLGLLAVAGYQNRDKLAEMLRSRSGGASPGDQAGGQRPGGLDGLLRGIGEGSGGLGSILGGGLSELADRFRQNGHGETVESWVGTGPNKEVAPRDLEHAIGADVLEELERQTGLPRAEILARLSRELPNAVDKYTPQGRVPNEKDLRDL